jgi:hypothetical protein
MSTPSSALDADRGYTNLAQYLYWAWVAHREDVTPETARKRYRNEGIPPQMRSYFIELAKKVDRDASDILFASLPAFLRSTDPKRKPS